MGKVCDTATQLRNLYIKKFDKKSQIFTAQLPRPAPVAAQLRDAAVASSQLPTTPLLEI